MSRVILVSPPPVGTSLPRRLRSEVRRELRYYDALLDDVARARLGGRSRRFSTPLGAPSVFYYGPLSLARALREAGHSVSYIWGTTSEDVEIKLFEQLDRARGRAVVGFTSVTPTWNWVARTASQVAKRFPNARIVVGGPHATYTSDKVTRDLPSAVLVRFAGQSQLVGLADAYPETPTQGPVQLATSRIEPDYSVLSSDDVRLLGTMVMGQQGCPRSCPFCVEGRYWSGNRTNREPGSVADEATWLAKTGGRPVIHIADSSFTADEFYAAGVLDSLERSAESPLVSVNLHLHDLRNPHIADLLKSPAVIEVMIGLETLSDAGSRVVGRGDMSFEEVAQLLADLRSSFPGVISAYSMLGLPGETERDITQSVSRFASLLGSRTVDVTIPKFFVPYPGTPFYERADDYGLVIDDSDYSHFERWRLPRVIKGNVADEDFLTGEMLRLLDIRDQCTALVD